MKRIFHIFGAGGHAAAVASAIIGLGEELCEFVDPYKAGGERLGYPIRANLSEDRLTSRSALLVAIGDNFLRSRVVDEIIDRGLEEKFDSVISANASIGDGTAVGVGSVLLGNCHVGPCAKIGNHVIVNHNAVCDHDCHVDDYASIGPSAALAGGVVVRDFSAIGIGAVVLQNTTVGKDVVIGANATVLQDIPMNTVAFGNPARVIRERKRADRYL